MPTVAAVVVAAVVVAAAVDTVAVAAVSSAAVEDAVAVAGAYADDEVVAKPAVAAADAFVARFVHAVQVCSTRQRALVKHCVQTAFEDESP